MRLWYKSGGRFVTQAGEGSSPVNVFPDMFLRFLFCPNTLLLGKNVLGEGNNQSFAAFAVICFEVLKICIDDFMDVFISIPFDPFQKDCIKHYSTMRTFICSAMLYCIPVLLYCIPVLLGCLRQGDGLRLNRLQVHHPLTRRQL